MQRISGLRLGTICDLRSKGEKLREPSRIPTDNPPRIVDINIAPGDYWHHLTAAAKGEAIADWQPADTMCKIYRAYAQNHVASYQLLIDEVRSLPENRALLFHCAAGKDRTGFGAALILMCLNVPRRTIEEDYLLTARYFIPEIELSALVNKGSKYGFDRLPRALLAPLFEVRPEYLAAAFEVIDGDHGGHENYLKNVFGLDGQAVGELRSRYLQ